MRKSIALFGFIVLAAASLAADVPKAIKAAYDRVNAAVSKCDFKTFKTYFSDDFKYTDPSGKTATRDEFFGSIEGLFKSNTSGTSTHTFKGSKAQGGIVDVSFEMHVNLRGKAGKTAIHEVGVDSWKKVKGKWVMVKTVDTVFTVKAPK